MMKKHLGRRKRLSLTASSLSTSCALLAWLFFVDQSNFRVSAFDSFSSFTFGTQPGGRGPRFSFDGFPGTSGGNVDNEEYYKILEVGKSADSAAITKAYRRLAKKKHPDKGGNPEEFKALGEAYEVLSDPERRQVYDQLGKEGLEGGAGGAGMDQSRQQADLFRSFFGRFAQQTPRMRDVVYEMEVTLEELAKGGVKKVRIWSEQPAEMTDRGDAQKKPERLAKDIEINLRSDMQAGSRVVLKGGVEPLQEGIEPGDLVFIIRESRHRTFRRLTDESPHLVAEVTVTLSEALTGFVRQITLLDGRSLCYRPEEGEVISPGAVRRLKGCGMPVTEGVTGDLYLRFTVEFPSSKAVSAWGEKERQVLEELLPAKPKLARDKKKKEQAVSLDEVEPHVQSRFKAGLYDRPSRGAGSRAGLGDAWGAEQGNPFGFFGL